MSKTFALQKDEELSYAGPVDVLLNLIEKEQLEITDISLIKVAKQFIDYIQENIVNPDELADFLYVLSVLLLIKSKVVLKRDVEKEEIDVEIFKEKLKILKIIREKSEIVKDKFLEPTPYISRSNEKIAIENYYFPLDKLYISRLARIYKKINDKFSKYEQLESKIRARKMEIGITLRKKMDMFKKLVSQNGNVSFQKICKDPNDKLDVILSFLALLEMTKNNIIQISQNKDFGDITMSSI